MNNGPRPVLIIAEQANPKWVSVPLVGWRLSERLARQVAAHLVTHVRNQAAIEQTPHSFRGVTFLQVPVFDRFLRLMGKVFSKNTSWTLVTALRIPAYIVFEIIVWRRFRADLKNGKYALVHRVTPLSPALPSYLARKCRKIGVPFLLGPLNGNLAWPREFRSAQHREREWLSSLRGGTKLVPFSYETRAHATAIVVGSRSAWEDIPKRFHEKCFYQPENAIESEKYLTHQQPPRPQGPLRIAFVGRLVPLKGVDILISACAPLLIAGKIQLEIIGDGPEMTALQAQASLLGVLHHISFSGWVSHDDLPERLMQSSVFAFPSIRDFGGGAVIEAMALGLVPVVIDYGGPREIVTPEVGFRVPMGPKPQMIAHMTKIFDLLAAQPDLLTSKAQAARERVREHFTWDKKAENLIRIYKWILGECDRPSFPLPQPLYVDSTLETGYGQFS